MTRLALGAKCGAERMPPVFREASWSAANRRSLSSDANAAVPIPAAVRPNNWRRVRSSWCSWYRSMAWPILSFCQCLIEVQNHAGDCGPGGQFRHVQLLVPFGLADGQQLAGGL